MSAAGKLLAREPEIKANFSRAQGAVSQAKTNKVARFLPNPQANWGPKPKHGRFIKVCSCAWYCALFYWKAETDSCNDTSGCEDNSRAADCLPVAC